jgi:hypothetical protein
MGEVKISKVENKIFFLGDNDFETGVLTIPAGGTVPAGALLKRLNGKFVPVVNTNPVQIDGEPVPGVPVDVPVAVNPVELKNPGTAPADIPFRAMISGRVRFDMLSVNGQPITDTQADMIRLYGITPKKVTDISWT